MRLRYVGFLAIVALMAVVLAACGGEAAPTATTVADYTVELAGIASGSYRFHPKDLSLTAGKTYTIKVMSDAEFHTWTVRNPQDPSKPLIDVQVLPGETKSVEFTAPAAGAYELVCVPHEALGMRGTITAK